LEEQGYNMKQNILLRDNQSSMKMEMNGRASSGNRTSHFNIKYFYVTDLNKRKEVTIQYCPTELMVADYMTKPLTGAKFHKFCKLIMNYGWRELRKGNGKQLVKSKQLYVKRKIICYYEVSVSMVGQQKCVG
jgi:hypothetical protein